MQLELRHISKTFGPLKANNDINHTFQEGRIYAILGENGAGKSTLMKIISGYQQPDTGGELLINGTPTVIHSPSDALNNGIGMLYQDPLDFPPMTVLENYLTSHPRTGFLPDRSEARREFLSIAQRFGFHLDPDMLIEGLTIGERQQLEIVRLLSLKIGFLILDEPTTGISEAQRQTLFSTLKQLAAEDKLTIALVTHKLADVEELCDEVMVLRHGRVSGTCTMPQPPDTLVRMMFGHTEEAVREKATRTMNWVQLSRGLLPDSDNLPALPLGQPILQVKELTLQTRLLTIENITLDVREGEVIGLAGLDGSGQGDFMRQCAGLNRVSWRDHVMSGIAFAGLIILFDYLMGYSSTVFTTTLLLLLGLTLGPVFISLLSYLRDRTEHVYFDGIPTRWMSYRDLRERGLAYLSAGRLEEGLVTGMTLTQHFALAKLSKIPWVNWFAALRRTNEGIKQYDVRGQAFSPIQTLSGGNQQRVALALLADNLRLAFLENPTRGLDVNSARNIWHLLLSRREKGTAIVFSSPDLDEIVAYSDRVMVFSSGRCTLVDDPAKINRHDLGLLIGGLRHD